MNIFATEKFCSLELLSQSYSSFIIRILKFMKILKIHAEKIMIDPKYKALISDKKIIFKSDEELTNYGLI